MGRTAKLVIAGVAVAGLAWLFWRTVRNTNAEPYHVDGAALSNWTVVAGGPGDPALVGLQPPSTLSADLFQQVFKRTSQSLVSPSPAILPLVLKGEYAESLQGVIGVDSIMQLARESELSTARFEPVCMGHRRQSAAGASAELFFLLFRAPAFDDFRQELVPSQPEHGGVGVYDPAALRPILTIASTARDFARWWPIGVDEDIDCEATVLVK